MSDGPVPICREDELAEADAFWTKDVAATPVLVTRDRAGAVRAFVNLCRHRGVRLVHEQRGVTPKFTCIFHGWTYDAAGQMGGLPLLKMAQTNPMAAALLQGNALVPLASALRHGFVWAAPQPGAEIDVEGFLGPTDAELLRRGARDLVVATRAEEPFEADLASAARARLRPGEALHVPSDELAFLVGDGALTVLTVARRRAEDDFGDVRSGPETLTLETLVLHARG